MDSIEILSKLPINVFNAKRGQIQVILGPMFSGKTTELMRRLKRFQIAKNNCLVIKYANDTRYDSDNLATHDNQSLPAVKTTKLSTFFEKSADYSVIGIDEAQFFPDTVEFAEKLANLGKIVIVAALDGTYQRLGFVDILQLIPLAESVVKLTAVCAICCEEASYTKRTSMETVVEVIGGSDKYIAVCRQCYFLGSPGKTNFPSTITSLKPLQEKLENVVSHQLFVDLDKSDDMHGKENCSIHMNL